MLVKEATRDERGSALVSVVVMMLVLTLFGLTLGAIVTNTGATLAAGKGSAQARAAADAGVAAGLAAFKKAETCPGTISSATAPVYSVTCSPRTGAVVFTSTGTAADGRTSVIEAVYGYTTAQTYEPKSGLLTFFSATAMYEPNVVTSATPDPVKVVVAAGDFQCKSALAANLTVEGDFFAYYGCAVSGAVTVKGTTTMYGGSSVASDLTTGGWVILNSVSSVGGRLVAGGNATIYGASSVGKDLDARGRVYLGSGSAVGGKLTSAGYVDLNGNSRVNGSLATGGYADLESGVVVDGDLTATGYADIEGTVSGDVSAGTYVDTGDNSRVTGSVKAAGSDRTWIRGRVDKDVQAEGPVTVYYNGVVSGDVTSDGGGTTSVYGQVRGGLTTRGAILVDYGGSVSGKATSAGTATTSVYGTLGGDLHVAGTVNVDYNGSVSGAVIAAGTGTTTVNGKLVRGLRAAGTVTVGYNGTIGSDLATSGTGTDNVYGSIGGDLNAGGNVYLPAGRVGGSLTLPPSKSLSPGDAKSRVVGNVTSKPAPATPSAPSVPAMTLAVPIVTSAAPTPPTLPQWTDYGYSSADWPGYSLEVLSGSSAWCSARNWATYLESFTTATVVDATRCRGGLYSHPYAMTTVTVSANVVVVSSQIDLHYVTFKAAAGTSPSLWFVVPSAGRAVKQYPGVLAGTGEIDLDSSNLDVPTLLYTPNLVSFHASTFTGSIYANRATFDGGTPGNLKAAPLEFPIALSEAAQSATPSGVFSVTRISQREVR